MAACDPNCCVALAGDVFIGPAMLCDGSGYADSAGLGWGNSWGDSWGGITVPTALAGGVGLPAARPLGNAQIAWTPRYRELARPARYGMTGRNCQATRVRDGADLTLTMYCHSFENMKAAWLARQSTTSAQNVVQEYLIVTGALSEGLLLPFAQAPVDSNSAFDLEVYNQATNVAVSLVSNTDYTISLFGARLLKSLVLGATETLRASYTSAATAVLDAHCGETLSCSLLVEARNLKKISGAASQKYKGRYGFFFPALTLYPSDSRELFSDSDFATFTMSGDLQLTEIDGCEFLYRAYLLSSEL